MPEPVHAERRPRSTGYGAAVLFLAVFAVFITFQGAWWALPLLFLELLHPYLGETWAGLNATVDRIRADLAPLKRFPGALVGIPLLFVGLALGVYLPDSVEWLGTGVKTTVGYISQSAPYVIFFTLTPAIAGMVAHAGAGKFALWVNASYVLTTAFSGVAAALLMIPIFGVRLAGPGISGNVAPGQRMLELVFTSDPFLAIFAAAGVGLMIHGFHLRGLDAATRFVGGKLVDLLGDILKIVLPLVLFALGVFIPTTVARGIAEANREGVLEGTGWISEYAPETAYFITVGILVLALAAWMFGLAFAITQHTRLPFRVFFLDYFVDVYSYAWATASSSATIPINLERAGTALGVRRNIRDFIIPLGATVNLNGTMIGGIVTAVVASQMVGYTPSIMDLLILILPLVVICIGVPGIPGGLAAVAPPVMVSVLPIPEGTAAVFTAIFVGFNIGLGDQFRTGVSSVDNGLLARLFEYWWPTHFGADPTGADAKGRLGALKGASTSGGD